MAALAKTILIAGLVMLNIPHLLCPLTCAADTSVVANGATCPHCSSQNRPEPKAPTPTDDCPSGCCDQDPAVLVPVETLADPQMLQASFITTTIALGSTYALATLPGCMRVDYWPPPPSFHAGSRFSILFERFLL